VSRPFVEHKLKLDGRLQTFECEPVAFEGRRAICLYRSTGDFQTSTFRMTKGGLSYGFFWRYRPYILYRISHPDGGLIGHRFDVVDRVRIAEYEVSYRDLVVDAWVPAGGEIRLEDEDELAAFVAAGEVSRQLETRIERTARGIVRSHRRILTEVEAALALVLPRTGA
jgi:hypothetical protein